VRSALAVLEAVAHLGAGVSAQRISTELGLPRATTYRLLNLLVEDEYLVRTPDLTGFALGARVAQLTGVVAPPRLPSAARTVLAEARRAVRGGVHVVLFLDGRLVVIDADPDFPFSDEARMAREPARYALGRLLLLTTGAGVDPAVADDYQRFGATRQSGEVTATTGCLALPIRDDTGATVGALGFSGARHRVDEPAAVIRALEPTVHALAPLVV
jgi:DNA-binding IclR family transcriptional regulator